jgi:hypothetical protein
VFSGPDTAGNKEAREILYEEIKRGSIGRAECDIKTKNELKRKRKNYVNGTS